MATCLFTGEELGAHTREEHTIQRSLGGRIRSHEVSSDSFNQRCGELIDPYIGLVYADIMSVLGPALPSGSRGGDRRVQILGQPGRYVVDNQGELTMRGATVVGFDPVTNRPTAVLGVDEAAMRRIIEQNMPPSGTQSRTNVMPPSQDVVFPRRPVLCAEIELAALKSALLSFDHLLRNQAERFTRSPALHDVREFVRRSIMVDGQAHPKSIERFVLGLQYNPPYTERYEEIRRQAGFLATPFEHVLIASADPTTRTLDLVFWVCRVDPHAFRLCHDWRADAFTYVAVNGVLADTTFSDAIRLVGGEPLGRPNQRRSHLRVTGPIDPAERAKIRQELFERRAGLYQQAVDYIERRFDNLVIEHLERYAQLNPDADHLLTTAVRRRLAVMFHRRIGPEAARRDFDRIVDGVLAGAPVELCPPPIDGGPRARISWPFWLALERQCLDALREPFGLPGDIYQADSGEHMSEGGRRQLGRWPDRS